MYQPYFTQGSSVDANSGTPVGAGASTEEQYSDFMRSMNDSGVSVSHNYQNQPSQPYHYYGEYQQYGQDYDASKQSEEYLKQWAEYYENLHGNGEQIRYDYKNFQNQSDPDQTSDSGHEAAQSEPDSKPQPEVKRKIAMFSSSFNFVKASSEFKSTDLSEEKKEKQKNLMIPTVLAGKNRLGLGALNAKSAKSSFTGFIAAGKGTAHMEIKFNNFCKEVKNRNQANKHAIEILHQSADRCKMPINVVFHTNNRMPDGRVKYTCNLEIADVFISDGGAPSKKVAKMEAYSKALTLLTNPPVAVKEENGHYCLIQKVEIGPVKPDPQNKEILTNKDVKNLNQMQAGKQNENEATKIPDSYTKPKMVFHKASEPVKPIGPAPGSSTAHPLSDKPLEFKRAEPGSKPPTRPTSTTAQGTAGDRAFNEEPYGRPGFYNNQNWRQDERSAEGNYETQHSGFGSQYGGFGPRQGGFGPRHGGYGPRHGGFGPRHGGYQQGGFGPRHSDFGPRHSDFGPRHGDFGPRHGDFGPRHGGYQHDGFGFEHGGFHEDTRNQHQHSGFQRKEFQREGHIQEKRGPDKFDKPNAVKKKQKTDHTLDDLSDFIIMDYSKVSTNIDGTTAISALHNSANFNHVILKYQFESITDFGWRCNILLSDMEVASVLGTTKDDAKKNAAEEALKSLKEICYTIVVKKNVDNDAEGLTKDELVSDVQRGGNAISDNNIGNMLLRKMGWAGGGVGKHGTGIAEPVKAGQVIGRQGLGLIASQGIGDIFYEKVQGILDKYVKSSDQNDLHFSPEFTKEERAVIHKMAQKYGLKTQSKGRDDARFLILSRKRSAGQLLDHVMSSGGATSKYEVIPPSKQKDDEEYFARDRKPVWDAVSYGHSKQ